MKLKIVVITTAHWDFKPQDTEVLLFVNGESEHEIVKAMAENYFMDEDENFHKVNLPETLTWDWFAEEIDEGVWWEIDERVLDIKREGSTRA